MGFTENDDIKEASNIPSHLIYVYSLPSTARQGHKYLKAIWRNDKVQTNLEVQFLCIHVVN